jgi:hypothetical protein
LEIDKESNSNKPTINFDNICKNEYYEMDESICRTDLENKKSNPVVYFNDVSQLKGSKQLKPKNIDNLSSCSNFDIEHRKLLKLIYQLNRKMEKAEKNIGDHEIKDKYKKQWHLMADVIDRVLFIVFFILTFAVLGEIIFEAPNAKLKKIFE